MVSSSILKEATISGGEKAVANFLQYILCCILHRLMINLTDFKVLIILRKLIKMFYLQTDICYDCIS